jgi:predicted nuclease with TOPRIM domain
MDELRKEYKQLLTEYDRLIAEGDVKNYDRIKELNVQIARVLEQMLTILARVRDSINNTQEYRDTLVEKLKRIQLDYNGLLQTTDKLETLRRIRAQEKDDSRGLLFNYLIALAVLIGLVLLVMIVRTWFYRRSTSASTTSPATIAPLT